LLTLGAGQFLMTLDTSVMNVAIATVAEDVGTDVTGSQTAITLYTLVMATLMITGGKVGALIGRKRAFAIGSVIYGTGSFVTAISPSLPVLLVGWSFLEGVGAALILPAIVALVAANFGPQGRPRAYGLVMAAGAIAVAIGPLIGGLFTTYLSWRLVFAGEVLIVLGVLALTRRIQDEPPGQRPKIDLVGVVLSAAGLGRDGRVREVLARVRGPGQVIPDEEPVPTSSLGLPGELGERVDVVLAEGRDVDAESHRLNLARKGAALAVHERMNAGPRLCRTPQRHAEAVLQSDGPDDCRRSGRPSIPRICSPALADMIEAQQAWQHRWSEGRATQGAARRW
jgi:Major Facilitator Superfamily